MNYPYLQASEFTLAMPPSRVRPLGDAAMQQGLFERMLTLVQMLPWPGGPCRPDLSSPDVAMTMQLAHLLTHADALVNSIGRTKAPPFNGRMMTDHITQAGSRSRVFQLLDWVRLCDLLLSRLPGHRFSAPTVVLLDAIRARAQHRGLRALAGLDTASCEEQADAMNGLFVDVRKRISMSRYRADRLKEREAAKKAMQSLTERLRLVARSCSDCRVIRLELGYCNLLRSEPPPVVGDAEVRQDIKAMAKGLSTTLPNALLGYMCKHEFSHVEGQRLHWVIVLRDVSLNELPHVADALLQHWHAVVPKATAVAFNLPPMWLAPNSQYRAWAPSAPWYGPVTYDFIQRIALYFAGTDLLLRYGSRTANAFDSWWDSKALREAEDSASSTNFMNTPFERDWI